MCVQENQVEISCYACGNFGHTARACTVVDSYGWRRTDSGKRVEATRPQPRGAPAVMVGCTEPATAALDTVTLQVDKGGKKTLKFYLILAPN
jgi:hypothetical protein